MCIRDRRSTSEDLWEEEGKGSSSTRRQSPRHRPKIHGPPTSHPRSDGSRSPRCGSELGRSQRAISEGCQPRQRRPVDGPAAWHQPQRDQSVGLEPVHGRHEASPFRRHHRFTERSPLLLAHCERVPGRSIRESGRSRPQRSRPDLSGAALFEADLTGAVMVEAALADADLSGAKLAGADLSHRALRGARLRNADLTGADLTGADLKGAGLRGANLSETNLTGTLLAGADLTNAKLTNAVKVEAVSDETTTCPGGKPGPCW